MYYLYIKAKKMILGDYLLILSMVIYKQLSFIFQLFKIIIIFSSILAKYRAPFNTKPTFLVGFVLNRVMVVKSELTGAKVSPAPDPRVVEARKSKR